MVHLMELAREERRRLMQARSDRRQKKYFSKRVFPLTPAGKAVVEKSQRICTEAFLENKPATTTWVDWGTFLNKKDPQEHVMTPIQAVMGELEEQTWPTPVSEGFSTVKRVLTPEEQVKHPLPERIRIHFSELWNGFTTNHDRSMCPPGWSFTTSTVLIRPYRSLIYLESQLRKTLHGLESHFENWDGVNTPSANRERSISPEK